MISWSAPVITVIWITVTAAQLGMESLYLMSDSPSHWQWSTLEEDNTVIEADSLLKGCFKLHYGGRLFYNSSKYNGTK